jgi:2-polyprenyl-3-methyl-5-hydroxy-6-metoxy-1,4-benzoquinol methylase
MKPPTIDPAWDAETQALHRHDLQEIWDRRIAPQVWNQYHNQLDVYLGFAADGRPLDILDVGCAQGTLALLLAERGHRVTAMDIRQHFLDYAASRYTHGDIRWLRGNVLEAEPEGCYDLIFANQIIEHLVYPDRLLAALKARAKPGARIVITTPNHAYAVNRLPSFRELGDPTQWAHRQHSADADGHFYAYTRDELVDIFASAGLNSIESRFFETPWISGHLKVRYLHGIVPVSVLRALDRLTLALPWVGARAAHQLLVTGRVFA